MTEWKTLEDFNNYEVSDDGQVRNRKTGRVLKTRITNSGYQALEIYNDEGKRKFKYLHRLVAQAFVPNSNIEEFEVVNHIDEDKYNNNYTNLEWTTREINTAIRTKRHTGARVETKRWDEHGERVATARSIRAAADWLHIHFSSALRHYHAGTITAGGYYIVGAIKDEDEIDSSTN